jgi:hypothetical protein
VQSAVLVLTVCEAGSVQSAVLVLTVCEADSVQIAVPVLTVCEADSVHGAVPVLTVCEAGSVHSAVLVPTQHLVQNPIKPCKVPDWSFKLNEYRASSIFIAPQFQKATSMSESAPAWPVCPSDMGSI